tara:strand:+ start:2034 stop:3998 length:1965 start_codon:yes stop_codon:yes gene_type:complete
MALSKAQKASLEAKREEARLDEKRQKANENYLDYLKAKEAGETRSYRQYRAHQRYVEKRDADQKKAEEERIALSKKRIDVSKKGQNLAKSANKLANSSKSTLLEMLGIKAKDLSLVKAAAAARKAGQYEEAEGFNAMEALRQEAISQLEEGTFVQEEFNSKVDELKDKYKDLIPEDQFENFKDSFESAGKNAEGIANALNANIPFLDKVDDLKQKAEDFTAILTSGPAIALAAVGLLVKAVTDFVMQAKEARQELGITAGSALALSADMEAASKAGAAFGGDAEKASASVRALAESMGRVPQLSTTSAAQFGVIASLSGASAESLATIVELQALSQGISADKAIDDLASLEALAESEGVLKSQVFDDVANAAKDQALFFGKSAEEIGKAAVEMRKLGIEASALNSLAESLLDLESSISSEFELQLLFGKNINLNKAREAAFNRDSAALAKEIKMQLGGQFDLSTANAAQVKSLTQAFGLTQEQLQKVIQGQDIFNSKTEEGNQGLLKQIGMYVGIATALGGAIGFILGSLGIFTGGVTWAALGAGTKGAIIGAGVGGTIGGLALGATKMEDASIERKSVGSMEPAATFSLGDAASINVSKSTQDAINLEMGKLVSVIREELVAEVKSGNKDNKETLNRVISSNEETTRAVRQIM